MNEFIIAILGGQRDSFREVVREYGPGIRAYLAGHLRDPHTVDDLAQEVFVAAFEGLSGFDLQRDFGTWLRGIAKNKLSLHLRHMYREGTALERLKASISSTTLSTDEPVRDEVAPHHEKLKDCLKKLPPRLEHVIHARYFGRQKVQTIATELQTSATAISSLLFRGRKELESCLEGVR